MRSSFKSDYGDIAHLLYVPIDETLLQALVQYWNPPYSCFTFGSVDLTPTIEEYSSLINCSKIDNDRIYSKSNKNKHFRRKLERLLGALPSWVEDQVAKNNQKEYLKWEGILALASASPGGQVQRDMLAFLIYGLVIFLKALGHINVSVIDLSDRSSGGINPVPLILEETFRTLKFCKRNGGRFQGCSQLLTVWFHSHMWTDAKLSRSLYDGHFSPLEEFLRKED
ncbi:hypothetical protein GQ457_04G016920 [Hibiscus cannabinus]